MRIGLLLQRFGWPPGTAGRALARIGRDAEQAGLSSIWVNDHFRQIPMFGDPGEPFLEAYTALSYLAAATERIGLGTMTTAVTHRHPALLLKTLTSLDALSGGRVWLGLGPPWHEEEHRAFGLPLGPWSERFERLEDTLALTRQVLSGVREPFEGKHYRLPEPWFAPSFVRPPPVLVGGAHERRVLRLVARYGDACGLHEDGNPAVVGLKLRMLRDYCAELGRPFEEITVTTYGTVRLSATGEPGTSTVAEAARRFGELAALGVHLSIVDPGRVAGPETVELLGELAAAVAPP